MSTEIDMSKMEINHLFPYMKTCWLTWISIFRFQYWKWNW